MGTSVRELRSESAIRWRRYHDALARHLLHVALKEGLPLRPSSRVLPDSAEQELAGLKEEAENVDRALQVALETVLGVPA